MTDVLIVCGGTGGHLAPGIALAEELNSRDYSTQLYISEKSIDGAIIEKYKALNFACIPGSAFSNGLLGRLNFIYKLICSLPKIIFALRKNKPQVIVLFGGFLSLGFGLVGFLFKQKIILHEANCRVGKAVKVLKNFADRVYLPEGVHLKKLPQAKLRHYGYPLRKEIKRINKDQARSILGVETKGKLLVVIGGSQGAEVLNNWVIDHFKILAGMGVSIYCITGLNNGLESEDQILNEEDESIFIKMVPFSSNMAAVMSAGDLVISRAGAGSIAEIIRCKVASILIPYPYAADNHQMINARMHESLGAGVVLDQNDLENLIEEVRQLISNDTVLDQFKINLENMARLDSSVAIVDDLEANFFENEKNI